MAASSFTASNKSTPEIIRHLLSNRSRRELDLVDGEAVHAGIAGAPGARHAAVLLAIHLRQAGNPEMLFVVRSTALRQHPGQIAFPGGRVEQEDEDHIQAALREAEEEVAIPSKHIQLLGLLDDQYTKASHHVVTPALGILDPDFEPWISSTENESLFWISLLDLNENCQQVPLRAPGEPWQREQQWIFNTTHGGIWGLSSRITRNLLDIEGLLPLLVAL